MEEGNHIIEIMRHIRGINSPLRTHFIFAPSRKVLSIIENALSLVCANYMEQGKNCGYTSIK
ncbi:hypothetical protein HI914_01167 [Erysiphe necator]|nr:hypothetical protein HI914_01167 [Erysiphe necator]